MLTSIGLFICGACVAFCSSLAYDTMLENKELKEKIKQLETNKDSDINNE